MIDCEGTPVSAVDACEEPSRIGSFVEAAEVAGRRWTTADFVSSWMDRHTFTLHPGGPVHPACDSVIPPVPAPPEVKRVRVDDGFGGIDPEKVREALPGVPVVVHPTVKGAVLIGDEAARDLLIRSLEVGGDPSSFPPAGSVWRQGDSGAVGTVEYSPNGRRWRLLFDPSGRSEWCYDGIAEGWERVFERPPAGSVWRNARQGLTARVEHGKRPGRWRLVYENIPVGVPCPPASPWRDGMLSADWEPRDTEAAPQAVTLEVATINAADPAPYVSPSDVDLPRVVPGQVWRLSGLGRLEGRLVRVVRLSPPWAHVDLVEPADDESCPPILVGILRKWCTLVETAPEVTDG